MKKIILIGPEYEENMALRYLHASIVKKGHECLIVDFGESSQIPRIAETVRSCNPDMVGFSMVFTARCKEFITCAYALRQKGFGGHITAGGHFASFNAEQLLIEQACFDSIIHGEAETAIVELIENMERPWAVTGITFRQADGAIVTTGKRRDADDLDALPFPTRTLPFKTYLGIPIANMIGSRGCYGNCSFCSIKAWHNHNGGKQYRQRSVDSIVAEMSRLYHDHGVKIFNFHDDNFFHLDKNRSLLRFKRLHDLLEKEGIDPRTIALQIKARPDDLDGPTMTELKEAGLFRVFLGVENSSSEGLKVLGKSTTPEQNHTALMMLKNNDIHTTFNLLMFTPYTTMNSLRQNISFIREYCRFPLNFGRTEIYAGTPLEKKLREENRLLGDLYGYHYVITDEKVQDIFDIFYRVFFERNFTLECANHLAMKVDYHYYLLKRFYPASASLKLFAETKSIISDLNNNSASLLEEIGDRVANNCGISERWIADLLARRRAFDETISLRTQNLIRCFENSAERNRDGFHRFVHKSAALASVLVLSASAQAENNFTHICEYMAQPINPETREQRLQKKALIDTAYSKTGELLRKYENPKGIILIKIDKSLATNKADSAEISVQKDWHNDSLGSKKEIEQFCAQLRKSMLTWTLPKVYENETEINIRVDLADAKDRYNKKNIPGKNHTPGVDTTKVIHDEKERW